MDKRDYLEDMARKIRYYTMDEIGRLGVGHVGGCLSLAELLAVLYFGEGMRVRPEEPGWPERDRLVLSKAHAGPALYAALALKGYFPLEELHTLNRPGTKLPSHCDMNRTVGVDMTAGSLGQGYSCAVGMAKAAKIRGYDACVFAVIGDGEAQEGQIWEASMAAAHFKLDRLISFLDWNGKQIDGTVDEVMSLRDPAEKWRAFGYHVQTVDGHDVSAVSDAIRQAKADTEAPSMIILKTTKGKGVSFVEAAGCGNHNMPLTPEQTRQALDELAGR
ncbi:MAG: transketolase [Eubacteriales bacterium]|nr:transketolase [Eubacteriales bacterium]